MSTDAEPPGSGSAGSVPELRVLSIRHPWAWAIVHAGKDVENRPWTTPYRGLIGIHAGLNLAAGARVQLAAMGLRAPFDLPRGAVIGVARLVDCVRDADSPWAIPGHWHWQLADARPLAEPVPLTGRLQLFRAPVDVAEQVYAQIGRAEPGADGRSGEPASDATWAPSRTGTPGLSAS